MTPLSCYACDIIPFRPRRDDTRIHYRCPFCGGIDGRFDIGAQAWAVCETHRIKWWIGSNIDDTWLGETWRDWTANAHYLTGFFRLNGTETPFDEELAR